MTTKEIANAWPGTLAKIDFIAPKPLLPSATISFLHAAGLPRTFTMHGSQVMTFTTLATAQPLSAMWNERIRDWLMPVDWARYWRIGDIAYTQASAWLCVEEVTGRVCAIDIDIDDSVYPVNESLTTLASSMLHWVRWYESSGGAVGSLDALRQAFAQDVTFKPNEYASFWGMLIYAEAESGIERLTVAHS